MVKRKLNEKEIIEFLENEGFREIKELDKQTEWYKKASERPTCLESKTKMKSLNSQILNKRKGAES